MVELQDRHSTRQEETALRNKCIEKMAHTVRDFRSGLTRRVIREGEPEYVLSFYQMPNNGFTGNKTPGEWWQLGESIVAGEEKAVAKGFPAMTNPSVADLLVCMASFEERRIATDVADRNYREAQANMANLRKQVRLAARGLATTLRILLDGEAKSSVRRAMRGYGFRFYRKGEETVGVETVDETPQSNEEERPERVAESLPTPVEEFRPEKPELVTAELKPLSDLNPQPNDRQGSSRAPDHDNPPRPDF